MVRRYLLDHVLTVSWVIVWGLGSLMSRCAP